MEIKNQDQQDVGLKSTGELNLYLDLLAFSELSAEEQLAYKDRLKDASSEQVLEAAGEFPGFVEATESLTEPLNEASSTSEPAVVAADQFRASGPLSFSGFLFDPTAKAAPQVMSLVVCATCGSETDCEDLFCVECGTFMDEKADAQPSGSACDECGLIVTNGELICPACGSVSALC